MSRVARILGSPEAIICAVIGALYILVWPVGEYGINDDWAYVKSLEHLHVDGRLEILPCVTTALAGQLFWGVLFTKLFGFSFTVTKLSVVALHAVECVALVRVLGLCGVDRRLALAGALALALNPLHLGNAFAFMSDIPALAFQLLAMFCYLKALSRGGVAAIEWPATAPDDAIDATRNEPGRYPADLTLHGSIVPTSSARELLWLAAGSLAAGEAFLIRQNGILVPAALFIYLLLFERARFTFGRCMVAFVPAGLAVAGFLRHQNVHGASFGYTTALPQTVEILLNPPLADLPYIVFVFLSYMGWFLIPLAGALRVRLFRARSQARALLFGGIALAAVDVLLFYCWELGWGFPYIWNMITPFGLLRPNELFLGKREALWGEPVGWIAGVASLYAALALVFCLLCRGAGPRAERSGVESACGARAAGKRLFVILLGLQVIYVFATAPILFDRHLLLFAPTVVALFCILCQSSSNLSPVRYFVCLAPLAFYAVTATHDLHAVSRATFSAGRKLVEGGVDPRTINAGYAFDGWETYELTTQHPPGTPRQEQWWQVNLWDVFRGDQGDIDMHTRLAHAWWEGLTSVSTEHRYVVACFPGPDPPPVPDYVTERVFQYQNWWPWKVNSVAILRDAHVDPTRR